MITCLNIPFKSILISVLLLGFAQQADAQEIDFKRYNDYTITLDNISLGDLEFNGPVVSGGGIYEVELIDSYVLSVIGVKYLDVGVQITGDGELFLNGDPAHSGNPEKSIPFRLKAAYANRGQNNISDAMFVTVASGNIGSARFPIFGRQQQPPGPPPTPTTEGFDQTLVEETAYLYLYGEIDVGNVDAGLYTGTITIHVEYE